MDTKIYQKITLGLCLLILSKSIYSFMPFQFDAAYKGGNKRHIGYTEFTVPLMFSEQRILYTNIRGMIDSVDSQEVNVGLGYRFIYPEYIVGAYSFFDYRHARYDLNFKQITFGGELLFKHVDLRTNFYLPSDYKKIVGKTVTKTPIIAGNHTIGTMTTNGDLVVTALSGFDCEIGARIPNYEFISTFVAYYHFSGKNVQNINGIRGRTAINIFQNWLYLDGEINYDQVRKVSAFIGARISLPIGKNKSSQNVALDEMLQRAITPPIRDIDIKTGLAGYNTSIDIGPVEQPQPV